VLVSVGFAAAAMAYTVHTITFVTSSLRLLPQHERYVVLLKEYQRDFGELNDIVVVVEAPSPDESKAYAARFVQELGAAGVSPSRVTYRIDRAYFEQRGLLYLPVDELTKLRDRLFDYQEFIEGYAANPTLPRLLEGLNQQIANAMVLGFFDLGLGSGTATDLRFLESTIDQIAARLDGKSTYTSPWATAFSVGRLDDPDAGYFFSADGHWLFLFVKQQREEGNFTESRGTIEALRGTIRRLQPQFPGVRAGVTGGPAISNDEMATAFDDSKVATILAFSFTMLLLIGAFRRVVKPVLMLATLVVSLAWSMGIITLVVGHLSIFSVMFISIVVGIGIDYGVYLLYRYREELGRGWPPAEALRRTAERAGPGMLLGALTATGAFFVLVLTDFQGIREFGFVAGTAVLMAFLSMVTLFPAVLALLDGRRAAPAVPAAGDAVERVIWLERIIAYRKTIIALAAVVTAFTIWSAVRVGFDYNMLKLQAKGVESVAWEERILAKAGRSGFAALTTASSLDELRKKQEALAALPTVAKVESILMLVPDRQPEKVKLIQQFAPLLAPVRVGTATSLDPAALRAPLETLRRRLQLVTAEGGDKARREVQPILTKLDAVLDKLGRPDSRQAGPALEQLQGQSARDFGDKLTSFRKSVTPRLVEPGDAPPELRNRYVGKSGRYLLRIHPAVDIWQQAGAERFVTDLRRVDPDVTGPPITSYEAIRFIRHGYFQGTLYAFLLVVVVTAVILRSALGTALALAPLALGVLWTLGFMHLFGLDFNLANVWALPLIIGTAAEFGLNIFVRFQEGRDTGGPTLAQSTVMAVVLNGLTTMAGFASLMVAHHQGIFGLGLLLTVGMTTSLFASVIVLPVLLRMFYRPAAPDEGHSDRVSRAEAAEAAGLRLTEH
jgi:hopanoid biosynthesis associated RND transporter like protein HpnN